MTTDEKPKRNLLHVIDKLLAVVPQEHDFHYDLIAVRQSAAYSPPELVGLRWKTAAEDMHSSFGPPEKFEPWQFDAVRIWLDQPDITDEQIKALPQ